MRLLGYQKGVLPEKLASGTKGLLFYVNLSGPDTRMQQVMEKRMFNNFLASLRTTPATPVPETQRRYPRRGNDRCVVVIHGQTFPVENWSFGGVLLAADERLFGTKQDIEITLKFKLRNTIIDVTVHGHVVRKVTGRVAIEFEPLNKTIRRTFQQVLDDAVASEFATSQA